MSVRCMYRFSAWSLVSVCCGFVDFDVQVQQRGQAMAATEKVSNHEFEHHAARAEKIARCVSLAQWSSCPGHVCDTASIVLLRA